MSTPVGAEFNAKTPDFRPQLASALEHAVPHTPEDPLGNGEVALSYRDKPDDYVISFVYLTHANQVSTTNPAEYLELLRQAAEILGGNTDQEEQTLAYLEEAAAHERVHGEEAAHFGNSATVSHYGVEFMVHEDGTTDLWPFHFVSGPLKKVHHAWSAAAPEDRSDTDLAIVTDLGYPDDIGALRMRAEAEPPVEEDWQPDLAGITRDDIIRALTYFATQATEGSQEQALMP